jgi:hypothetical protein
LLHNAGKLDGFVNFLIIDNRIVVFNSSNDNYDRTYGPLTIETVRRNGRILLVQLDDQGKLVETTTLEVRRGR